MTLRFSRNSGEFCVPQLKSPDGDITASGRPATFSSPTALSFFFVSTS
jgi:hypothetical protein